jgi:hypothetical protein
MHGKVFLLDTGYSGIDDQNLYCRADFMDKTSDWAGEDSKLLLNIKTLPPGGGERSYKLEAALKANAIQGWTFSENGHGPQTQEGVIVVLRRESAFECRIPLRALNASPETFLRVRFSLWRGQLPFDALPQDGFIEVQVVPEEDLSAVAYAKP